MNLREKALQLADQIEAYIDSPGDVRALISRSRLHGNDGLAVKAFKDGDFGAGKIAAAVGRIQAKIVMGDYSVDLAIKEVRKLRVIVDTMNDTHGKDDYSQFYRPKDSNNNSCHYRDAFFIHLSSQFKPAAIRDHWSNLDIEIRTGIHPSDPKDVPNANAIAQVLQRANERAKKAKNNGS